jgi:hypothetical protein
MLCIAAAVVLEEQRFLIGLAVAAPILLFIAARYHTNAIIVRGNYLIFRRGSLMSHEIGMPLWCVNLDTRQSLVGRIFDYATVRQHWNGEVIEIRDVQQFRLLRNLIAYNRHDYAHQIEPSVATMEMQHYPTQFKPVEKLPDRRRS